MARQPGVRERKGAWMKTPVRFRCAGPQKPERQYSLGGSLNRPKWLAKSDLGQGSSWCVIPNTQNQDNEPPTTKLSALVAHPRTEC